MMRKIRVKKGMRTILRKRKTYETNLSPRKRLNKRFTLMGVLYFRTKSTTSRSSNCCHHDSSTNGTFHLFLPFNDHQFIFNQTCIIICKVVNFEIFARKHPTAPVFKLCLTYEQRDTASHFQII